MISKTLSSVVAADELLVIILWRPEGKLSKVVKVTNNITIREGLVKLVGILE